MNFIASRIYQTPASALLRVLAHAEIMGTSRAKMLDQIAHTAGLKVKDVQAFTTHEHIISGADGDLVVRLAEGTGLHPYEMDYRAVGAIVGKAETDDEDDDREKEKAIVFCA